MNENGHPWHEEELLGHILVAPGLMAEAAAVLNPDDFVGDRHRVIYDQLLAMHRDGETLCAAALRSRADVPVEDLARLIEAGASPEQFPVVLRRTQDEAARRRTKAALARAASDAASPRADAKEVLARAHAAIREEVELLARRTTTLPTMTEHVSAYLRTLDEGRKTAPRVPTGIWPLDDNVGGIPCLGPTVVGARPGMGKTSLATSILPRVIDARGGAPAFFFSLEMAAEELIVKLLGRLSGVHTETLMPSDGSKPALTDDEYGRLSLATSRLARLPIVIDDRSRQTPDEMRARIRQGLAAHGAEEPSMIVVDYVQLVDGSAYVTRQTTREQVVAAVMGELRCLARDFRCPTLVFAQLNRNAENRRDRRPGLADFRESGSLEQDAHMALGLYRPSYYDEDDLAPDEIIVLKNRGGPLGVARCRFHGPTATWADLPIGDNP